MEGFDVGAIPLDSADSLQLQIKALKLAFADTYEYVSDSDTMRVKNADLLDKQHLRTRSHLINMKKAQMPKYGAPASGGGTVYLTAADAHGMMVSYIQSNYQGFGSGIVVDASACRTGATASRCGPVMPTSLQRASGRFTRSSLRSSLRTLGRPRRCRVDHTTASPDPSQNSIALLRR